MADSIAKFLGRFAFLAITLFCLIHFKFLAWYESGRAIFSKQ